jgi:hypothetical protein
MKDLEIIKKQPKLGIIDELLNLNDSLNDDSLLNLLKSIINSNLKERIIDSLHNDESYLQNVSNHSYFHNNGFEKYVLDSSNELGMKLRLHVWPKQKNIFPTDIHNHPWQYASYLIKGSYKIDHYELSNEKDGFPYYKTCLPTIANMNASNVLQEKNLYYLKKTFSINCVEGMSHFLNTDILHRINQPNEITATLVLQGVHNSIQTETYNESFKQNIKPFEVERMSKTFIMSRIIEVL